MRAVIQFFLAVLVMVACVFGGSPEIDSTAVSLPHSSNIKSILPAPGSVVGIAHPVVVTFRAPVIDRRAAEQALRLKSTPTRTGKYEWLENSVVQWTPDRFWPAHSTVMLSVEDERMAFTTGAAVVGIASISDHTFTVTIDGRSLPDMPAPHHLPHAGEPGVLLASMGRPEYETPVGIYSVLSKNREVTMDSSSVGIPVDNPDGYRLTVDDAVKITRRGLYVHSAPWAVNAMGFENTSHGCISLNPEAAEWYFNNAHIGDPVIVQQ
jgi:lipoprotein-anchoring transpeptidase ErfK/SrfK